MLMSSSNRLPVLPTLAAALCLVFILSQYWRLSTPETLSFDTQAATQVAAEIPKKIWYKLGSKGLTHDATVWTGSCLEKNPTWAAEFMTDATAAAWVRKTYAHRPDIVESYLALQIPIIQADWLRYLLLYAEGGMWSDLDVSCNSPIESWIPAQYKDNVSVVVGWEFDTDWPGTEAYESKHELATWTVLAKPGSPHLLTAVEGVLQGLQDVARDNNVDVAGITATPPMMGDIVTFCGPRRMTRSIFQSLQRTLGLSDDEFLAVQKSTWFTLEPRLIGDVLVLPGFSFARSMNFYDESIVLGPSFVEHHYAGSWKNDKGGEF